MLRKNVYFCSARQCVLKGIVRKRFHKFWFLVLGAAYSQ